MNNKEQFFSVFTVTKFLIRWTLIAIAVSAITGSLVALFLWSLDQATQTRWQHPWLLYLLPVAGIGIHFLYKLWGKNAEAGNNLIMDEIHEPGRGVPARMAPLVILTTVVTHLFGGSAGREGTAVQVGGSMAGLLGRWLRLTKDDTRIMLMCGIAGGFGAVFGTPVAGTVFALEVLAIGRIRYNALIPCFITAVFSDVVCTSLQIHHTHYSISYIPGERQFFFLHADLVMLLKVIVAGAAFGLCGRLFAGLSHAIKRCANQYIKVKWLIPVVGGMMVIGLTWLAGTSDYLGIGVTAPSPGGISIVNAFHAGGANSMSWLWKLVFTAVTLGMCFKGGEVTPLFFIGATLGNTFAMLAGAPVDLFAGLGFIAVFAGATNTPLACALMGVELFGGGNVLYYAVACFTAYYFSGHSGIYSAQRSVFGKYFGV